MFSIRPRHRLIISFTTLLSRLGLVVYENIQRLISFQLRQSWAFHLETYKCQFDISSFRKTDINGRVSRNSYLDNLTPSILSPTSPLPFLSHVRVLYNTLYCFRSMRRSAVSCHRFIASARPVRHH